MCYNGFTIKVNLFRSMRAEIRFKAKTIVMLLSRDIYSDHPKNNIIIKFSVCVINVL